VYVILSREATLMM